jgi:hypothetical protein
MLHTPPGTSQASTALGKVPPLIWLASYPRSGNTMLRTIMFNCFGVRSGSVYPRDVSESVGRQIGHVEHGPNRQINLTGERFWLIKTHGGPQDGRHAIYVLRNGREATLSYHRFLRGTVSLKDIIEGRGQLPSWSDHLARWNPLERPGTLVLRYEEMVANLGVTVDTIARFLDEEPVRRTLPDREALADGLWIVSAKTEKSQFDTASEEAFERINGAAMRQFGYA